MKLLYKLYWRRELMKGRVPKIKSIAEYDIHMDQKLGEGGFGEVYIAEDTKRKEKVAIKFIHKNESIFPS